MSETTEKLLNPLGPLPEKPGAISDGTYYIIDEPALACSGTHLKSIVCIHGIGGSHTQFNSMTSALVDAGFRVIRYDLIGRGYSKFPEDKCFNGAAHVKQLRTLIESQNLQNKKISLLAHSMGGAIASLYVEQYHSEIESVVLLAPAGLMQPGPIPLIRSCCSCFGVFIKAILRNSQEKAWRSDFVLRDAKAVELQEKCIEDLQSIYAEAPTTFEAFWQSVLQFPLYGLDSSVARIATFSHIPVLILWGDCDTAVPYSPSFNRWKTLLDARLTIEGGASMRYITYTGLGHGFFIENPDTTNKDVLLFLREVLLMEEEARASELSDKNQLAAVVVESSEV